MRGGKRWTRKARWRTKARSGMRNQIDRTRSTRSLEGSRAFGRSSVQPLIVSLVVSEGFLLEGRIGERRRHAENKVEDAAMFPNRNPRLHVLRSMADTLVPTVMSCSPDAARYLVLLRQHEPQGTSLLLRIHPNY
ncbi:uncharacterized protein SCHCODRAFT_02174849 [Schizophyllum commune H4-8]|uniref:uncharacterized protein n=1 Tax=Schizophyllum commune (strain H4-8 / FGSC 9210) TaxID=578458 RepID=UPI00215FAAFC|nr:uncharacterized protein SCHCODRAFT_02174849 [Schizophyllum commune H4-8]KAI5898826.1 hypothetical protein SCHCODRAFT_02174849 [Schizophyllum commune H4-8]